MWIKGDLWWGDSAFFIFLPESEVGKGMDWEKPTPLSRKKNESDGMREGDFWRKGGWVGEVYSAATVYFFFPSILLPRDHPPSTDFWAVCVSKTRERIFGGGGEGVWCGSELGTGKKEYLKIHTIYIQKEKGLHTKSWWYYVKEKSPFDENRWRYSFAFFSFTNPSPPPWTRFCIFSARPSWGEMISRL